MRNVNFEWRKPALFLLHKKQGRYMAENEKSNNSYCNSRANMVYFAVFINKL